MRQDRLRPIYRTGMIEGRRSGRRGGVLIGALTFTTVIALFLAGIGRLVVSHYSRARVESDYAAALHLAEAGVNYEFRKISSDPASADQAGSGTSPGVSYSLGGGTFRVYCTNKDGTTPWNTTTGFLYVVSTGTISGVSRTVKVSVKGYAPPGKYAIYTMNSLSIWHGSAMDIVGDVGTNSLFDFTGHPNITGSVYFDGANAGWYNNVDPGGYTIVREPRPVTWPTVDQEANKAFPQGGLTWLATHNDNATANPPIVGNSITSKVTLKGPGNYYVTNINLNGQDSISFDNTNGPVNLWIGPSGGTGTARFRGGTAAITTAADPTKACHIYCATQSGIDLAGNETIDAVIYAYNKDAMGHEYGYATNSGNPVINGQILANKVDINGNISVNFVPGLVQPTSYGYYGFDNSWLEINGVNQ